MRCGEAPAQHVEFRRSVRQSANAPFDAAQDAASVRQTMLLECEEANGTREWSDRSIWSGRVWWRQAPGDLWNSVTNGHPEAS